MESRENRVPPFLLERPLSPSVPQELKGGRLRVAFLERGLRHAAEVVRTGYAQWELASGKGLLQGIDARIKVLFLAFFIFLISLKRELSAELGLGSFIFILAALSGIGVVQLYKRALFFGFIFGFLIALPSSLNIITNGEIVIPLATLPRAYDVLVYHIPGRIGITREGLFGVAMLTLRVVNSVSLSFLVLSTTPFPEIIKALKIFRAPDTFLVLLTLSYKYIFIFAKTIGEMYLAKKGRLAGEAGGAEGRQWIVGRMGFIFRKTQSRCDELFKAMLGRGFSDSLRLHGLKRLAARDWIAGIVFGLAGSVFLIL